MSNQIQNPSVDSKRLRFDEDNLQQTNHPLEKDYGLMSIPESKTPYPSNADPVEAKELRRRLQEALERANKMMNEYGNNQHHNSEDNTPEGSVQRPSKEEEELLEKQRSEFLMKRKQFYQSEFLIAKQKNMSKEMHPPGPSVGNNWRIDEADEHPHSASIISSNTRIASIISRHRLRDGTNAGSSLNQETLREIAEQISRSRELRN